MDFVSVAAGDKLVHLASTHESLEERFLQSQFHRIGAEGARFYEQAVAQDTEMKLVLASSGQLLNYQLRFSGFKACSCRTR